MITFTNVTWTVGGPGTVTESNQTAFVLNTYFGATPTEYPRTQVAVINVNFCGDDGVCYEGQFFMEVLPAQHADRLETRLSWDDSRIDRIALTGAGWAFGAVMLIVILGRSFRDIPKRWR